MRVLDVKKSRLGRHVVKVEPTFPYEMTAAVTLKRSPACTHLM